MTVGELIERLRQTDPNLLVCVVDGESGEDTNVNLYEVTRHVDRRNPNWPYVGDHPRLQPQERVVLVSQWGITESDDVRHL